MKPRPQLPRLIRGVQLNVEEPYPFYSRGLAAGDAAGFAESVAANTLIVFARDAWGRSLYESRLYPRHPGSLRLEELDAEAAARGLRLIVMTSHTSNPYLAERHPDWVQRGPDGSPRTLDHNPRRWRGKPLWPLVCPNSPALRLYLAPEAGEALDAAPHASGVLLDSFRYMPDPGRACFCRWCRERFRRETGLELPAGRCGACEAEYREAWEWRLRVHVEAVEAIAREVHSRGGLLLYNSHPGGWSGRGTRIVYMARGLVDAVFAELSEADEAGPLFTPFMVKLSLAASGWKPVLATRNAFHHLRTLHSAPQSLLARGVWEIVAAGGHPVVTVFASTLREDPRFAQALARVYRALDRLEELLVDRSPLYEAV
ncbi:MAG: hypothetical protein GXO15_05325, partial [Crenarchaeota archaeon]|nr:hypothetical protein [Thermoproteota archaeon]